MLVLGGGTNAGPLEEDPSGSIPMAFIASVCAASVSISSLLISLVLDPNLFPIVVRRSVRAGGKLKELAKLAWWSTLLTLAAGQESLSYR